MSTEPKRSKAAATPTSTADSSLTSIATAMAPPPARLISSTAACAAASCKSAITARHRGRNLKVIIENDASVTLLSVDRLGDQKVVRYVAVLRKELAGRFHAPGKSF